jgi:hypothetical protein
MRTLALLGIAAGLLCGAGTLTTPANAGTFAFLSRTGSGTACTLAVPCNSMGTAAGVAGAGGEVICLDKGHYGSVSITSTITISCGDGLWEAPGTVTFITLPAGADVVIEGLVADSLALAGTAVDIGGQGTVHLRRVRLGNNTATTNQFAVVFQPTGPAKLFVTDSFIHNFGASGISGAILLKPASGVTANVTIDRTRIENNRFGIIADGTGGGIVRGVVRDSVIAGSVSNGITVSTTSSSVVLSIDGCTISGNSFGLAAAGANAGMLIGRSVITANNTGLFISSAAALLSYGDNRVNANTSDGAFTGAVGLK